MVSPISSSSPVTQETDDIHTPHKVRFKRLAKYITYNSIYPYIIISIEDLRKDLTIRPRRITQIAIAPKEDSK